MLTKAWYSYPADAELCRVGVTGLFLGYYLPWDGLTNALSAKANVFSKTQPLSMAIAPILTVKPSI